MKYIVTIGLTRRLVDAGNPEHAIEKFLSDAPMRRMFSGVREDIVSREASPSDVADFHRGSRKPTDDQLSLVLDDARKTQTSKKEHA